MPCPFVGATPASPGRPQADNRRSVQHGASRAPVDAGVNHNRSHIQKLWPPTQAYGDRVEPAPLQNRRR
jgi:hypothetical protein